jgi:hypothetical protein
MYFIEKTAVQILLLVYNIIEKITLFIAYNFRKINHKNNYEFGD